MPDTLCRLAIHVAGADDPSTVDLMLPADCPVGALIPSIVDVGLTGSLRATGPQRWYLTRINGDRLDNSMTLRESAVHDGELILLTTSPPPAPYRRPGDPSGVVAGAADQDLPAALRGAVPAASLALTIVSAATLAWSAGRGGSSAHLWTAAALSVATATGALAIGRTARRLSVMLSLAAVVFATVTGFLAVPDAPWAPSLLLATSCGFVVSILLLRMGCSDTAELTGVAAVTGALAAVGLIGVTTTLPIGSVGAILTVLSLAALSTAPKLTVAAAGLGPSRPQISDRRAAVAHRVLTGLVVGWSSSAALGVAAVAAHAAVLPAVAVLFAADVGLLLLLRQRTHIDMRRRIALGAAGLCSLIAAHTVAVSAAPGQAYWLCAATVIASLAALRWAVSMASPNPVVRQGVQVLEYLALAAVVPLAAWVTGVYGVVRDLSLS